MFDIGFMEMLIIGVVALVVVGPERLPTLVKTTGMWVGRIRRALSGVKREIADELRVEEMRQQAQKRQAEMESAVDGIRKPFADSLREDILKPESAPGSDPSAAQSSSNEVEQPASADSVQSNK